jgi:hypothetical protein
MNDTITIVPVLAALGALVAATAFPLSAALVRVSARRLPTALALRMEEEWLCELNSINSRPRKLAFAVALILTRPRAFVAHGEEIVSERVTVFGGRKSVLVLSALVFAIAAYGASFLVPVRYESESRLFSYGTDNLIPEKIINRRFLKYIAQQMKWKDAMIDDLRRNVTVTLELSEAGSGAGSWWLVKYLGPDAQSAQQVSSLIDRHFLEEEWQHGVDLSSDAQNLMNYKLTQLAARVQKKRDELTRNQDSAAREMIALDHELLMSSYKAWFAKTLDREMTADLRESRFNVVEAPQLGKAVTPNRAGFAGLGALAGLTMGGIAVFGLDRRQRRLLALK